MATEDDKAAVLAELIGGSDTSHEGLVSGFLKRAKTLTTAPADMEKKEAQEEELMALCKAYAEYRRDYLNIMQSSMNFKKDHQDAGMLKSKATAILRGLYKSFLEFLVCELELNTAITILKKEIASLGGDSKPAENIPTSSLSNDLPVQVAVAIKKRGMLVADITRMEKIVAVVGMIEAVTSYMEISVEELINPEKSKELIAEFRKNFSKMKFAQARKVIAKTAEKESGKFFMRRKQFKKGRWRFMLEVTDILITLAKKFKAELLRTNEDIYMKRSELESALEKAQNQLRITIDFLDKYRIPEIRMRLEAIERQREKIRSEVGTVESYHDLIESLESKCLSVMPTLKEVNEFESGVYKKVNRTIDEGSSDVEKFREFIKEKTKNPDPEAISDSQLSSMQLKTD